MAQRAHPAAPSLRGGAPARLRRAQARSRRETASADLLLADDQRRQQPHHVVAGGDRDHLLGPQLIDQLAARHHRAQAEQQPLAAQLGDHCGIAVLDLGKLLLEQQPDPAHPLEEAVGEHHVEHCAGRRHGERIAAEGRAVGPHRHALGRLGGGEAGAEREAAAERLREPHDVGSDAAALIGEQLAGAADAGLHLVEDQEQPVIVAELAQHAQELRRHHRALRPRP